MSQTIGVIDTTSALEDRPAVIATVRARRFPRDISVDPATGMVLVANFNPDTVEGFREMTRPT